MLIKQSYFCNR